MIVLSDNDYQPLRSCRLCWRWTDPKYQEFPQETLDKIKPLSASKAHEIWAICRPFNPDHAFAPELFEGVVRFNVLPDSEETTNWLAGRGIQREQMVLVSWTTDDAVLLPFGLFIDYWDDFCYPSSDDVIIFPCLMEWALFYQHEGIFYFGRRRA